MLLGAGGLEILLCASVCLAGRRRYREVHLAVVGPSGIGKSTMASLLTGLMPPDFGSVSVPASFTFAFALSTVTFSSLYGSGGFGSTGH